MTPAVYIPLAIAGILLAGLAWAVIGAELALRRMHRRIGEIRRETAEILARRG